MGGACLSLAHLRKEDPMRHKSNGFRVVLAPHDEGWVDVGIKHTGFHASFPPSHHLRVDNMRTDTWRCQSPRFSLGAYGISGEIVDAESPYLTPSLWGMLYYRRPFRCVHRQILLHRCFRRLTSSRDTALQGGLQGLLRRRATDHRRRPSPRVRRRNRRPARTPT